MLMLNNRPTLTVKQAAKKLGVSPRRVRVLLAQWRLAGRKDAQNVWWVDPLLMLRPGTRGPRLRCKQRPKGSIMPERSVGMETARALHAASAQGSGA